MGVWSAGSLWWFVVCFVVGSFAIEARVLQQYHFKTI